MSRFEQISKLSSLKSKNKIIFDKDDPNKSLDLRPRMLIYEYIDVSCLAGGRSRREENDDDRWRSWHIWKIRRAWWARVIHCNKSEGGKLAINTCVSLRWRRSLPSFDFFQYTIPEWRTLPPISSDFSLIRGNRGVIEAPFPRVLCTLRVRTCWPTCCYRAYYALIHGPGLKAESISGEGSRRQGGLAGVSRLFKASFPRISTPRFGQPFRLAFSSFSRYPRCIGLYLSEGGIRCLIFFTTSPSAIMT